MPNIERLSRVRSARGFSEAAPSLDIARRGGLRGSHGDSVIIDAHEHTHT